MGYSTLKAALDAVVKTNGRQEITGSNLNGVMTTLLRGVDILDRANPADTTGMNKVVLDKGGTFSGQVTGTNTIYEIRDAFNLGGESVTIPTGCVLKFNGGSISNGSLVMQGTFLDGDVKIMGNVSVSGSVSNDYVTPMMFGAIADGNTNCTKAFENAVAICNHVVVPDGEYLISCGSKTLNYGIVITRSNFVLEMSPGTKLVADPESLPSTNQANQFRNLITIEGAGVSGDVVSRIENIIIRGGVLIGGRSYFTLPETGLTTETVLENYCGIAARYVDGLIIENTIITDNTGDAIYTGGVNRARILNLVSRRNRRAAVSIGLTNDFVIDGMVSDTDCQFVSYSNGNSSYRVAPGAIICTEPEPASIRGISNDPIQNVSIRNCMVNMLAASMFMIGCGKNMEICNNKLLNISGNYQYKIHLTDGGQQTPHYELGGVKISGNIAQIADGETFSTEERYLVAFWGYGDICVSNNKTKGLGLCYLGKYSIADIGGNFIDYSKVADISVNASTKQCSIHDNVGSFSMAAMIQKTNGATLDGVDVSVNNNITDGSYSGTYNSFVLMSPTTKDETTLIVVIHGNKVKSRKPFIVSVDYQSIVQLVLSDNSFDMRNTSELYFFDRNGNRRYVNLTMIGNYIKTAKQTKLLAGDYGTTSVVMKVLNNVFAGSETQFTTEEADATNLIFRNNNYIG